MPSSHLITIYLTVYESVIFLLTPSILRYRTYQNNPKYLKIKMYSKIVFALPQTPRKIFEICSFLGNRRKMQARPRILKKNAKYACSKIFCLDIYSKQYLKCKKMIV